MIEQKRNRGRPKGSKDKKPRITKKIRAARAKKGELTVKQDQRIKKHQEIEKISQLIARPCKTKVWVPSLRCWLSQSVKCLKCTRVMTSWGWYESVSKRCGCGNDKYNEEK